MFKLKDVTPSMLKCSHGFNHYGVRDSMFNDNMVEAYCPRCESIETWDHVARCPRTIEMRKKFMQNLMLEMLKNREKVEVNAMMPMCEDMLNQHHVGMAELFRSFVMIDWLNADVKCKDYKKLNKILSVSMCEILLRMLGRSK